MGFVIGIALFGLVGFLLWIMLKGLGVDLQWLNTDSKRLVRGRRKIFWAGAAAVPACIGVGAAIGAVVSPSGSDLGSLVKGEIIGGAVGLALTVLLFILAGPLRKNDGAITERTRSDEKSVRG